MSWTDLQIKVSYNMEIRTRGRSSLDNNLIIVLRVNNFKISTTKIYLNLKILFGANHMSANKQNNS